MENFNPQNMGRETSKVFAGNSQTEASQEAYNNTPKIFSEQIRLRLKPNKKYIIADVGSFKGELLNQIIDLNNDYEFETIAVDVNEEALKENKSDRKIVANAEKLPFNNKGVDIEIVRFVLQWNYLERQKQIIREIARTVKEFALVEHGGADNHDPEEYRKRMERLFEGTEVPKLKRGENFFSSRDEIENMMKEDDISFERIGEKVIYNISDIYAERFGLTEEERMRTKEILADKDFFVQTDWIIYPKD